MSKIKTVLAIGAAALLLASCGRPDQPAETEAPNVSSEVGVEIGTDEAAIAAEREAEPDNTEALSEAHSSYHSGGYQSEPEDDEISDDELAELALEILWSDMSYSEQSDLCWGWGTDRAMMLDAFMSGAGNSIPRSVAGAFFDGKC